MRLLSHGLLKHGGKNMSIQEESKRNNKVYMIVSRK